MDTQHIKMHTSLTLGLDRYNCPKHRLNWGLSWPQRLSGFLEGDTSVPCQKFMDDSLVIQPKALLSFKASSWPTSTEVSYSTKRILILGLQTCKPYRYHHRCHALWKLSVMSKV
jgi:hypothetical protein